MHRRDWLRTAGAALIGGSFAHAIEPIRRIGKSSIRLSLSAYSFQKQLNLKKPEMTLFDFIDLAATYPLDAVELTAYFFEKTTPEYLASLKRRCTREGLDVSGTAIGNNFCSADPAEHKRQIESTRAWIERTSLLGGKTMRIFAGNIGKKDDEDARLKQCVEAIQECCDHAAKFGIYLALENHGGVTETPEQMLKIVTAVKHDHFGVNLDTGNFHGEDPYADLEKLAPYTVVAQIKTEVRAKGRKAEDADLERLVAMLRKVNFRGYAALEYEAAEDNKIAVPRALASLRKLLAA